METYVCQATFYKILARTEFQHIQFPSAGKALYKTCNDCSMIEAKLQTTRDGLERARLKHQLASHLLLMMQERAFYSHSRMLARFTTSDHIFDAHTPSHMSIITDTMEQKKTQVPSQKVANRQTDKTDSAERLGVKVLGIIQHGTKSSYRVYLGHGDEFASDSNAHIQCIWKCIMSTQARYLAQDTPYPAG